MYKKLFLLFACILSVGFGFSWNNNFIDNTFWDENPTNWGVIDALYGYNSTYIKNRTGYGNKCYIPDTNIVEISEFPDVLSGNMIYILNTGVIFATKTITVGDCTAIISKSGTLIDNSNFAGDIFVINGKYSILDNISISGEKKRTQQYGIRINNTTGITLNNINIQGLDGGVLSTNSHYCKYNNIKVNGIYEYSIGLKNSHNNYISNSETSNSDNEAGFHIENSNNNNLSNLISHHNEYQGLYIKVGTENIIKNITSYDNNRQGIYIVNGDSNILDFLTIYGNTRDGIQINKNSTKNKINNIDTYGNGIGGSNYGGVTIYGSNNEIKNITSYNNPKGMIFESSSKNKIDSLIVHDNKTHGILINGGNENALKSGIIYNNNQNGIVLTDSNENTLSNIKIFGNGKRNENIESYCGITIHNNSNNNTLDTFSLLNNRIGICIHGNGNKITGNTFENMKIFNNHTLDSKTGDYEQPTYNGIIYGNINGNNNRNLKETHESHTQTGDSGLRVSFNDMINPQNENGAFLFSWTGGYEAIMGYQSGFSGAVERYSQGINLVGISGYIISNDTYAMSFGDIYNFTLGNTVCVDGRTNKCPVNIPITPTAAATWVNDQFVHAEVFFDTTAPTCQTVQYNITGNTAQDVVATLTDCDEQVTGTTSHTFTENGTFVFEYEDLIGNKSTGYAEVTRINKPKPNTGGGGGGSSSLKTTNQDTHQSAETKKSEFNFDKEKFDPKYSDESNMAYQRAYANNITTKTSIEESMMDESLDRIAMAKMLSQYAINILGKNPNTSQVNNFNDVTFGLDNDYNNGVTQSYQLGIMGQHIADNNFRPYDDVTRGEFTTALSRMLYDLEDGKDIFYSTHIKKLYDEGIITNDNPELKEVRGYVMIMLMRSDLGMTGTKNESIKNEEQHTSAKDIQNTEPYFTEPYKRLQIYRKIGDLQELLTYLGFFDGKINSVYNLGTIDAITDFQISIGLIDKNDLNNPARGYLGPATRAALDKEWYKYQQNK